MFYQLCMALATQDGKQEASRLDTLKRVCVDTHDQFEKIVKSARLNPGRAIRYASAGMEYASQMARKIDHLLSNEDDCGTPMEEPDADDLACNDPARMPESDFDKQAILGFVGCNKRSLAVTCSRSLCRRS
ncbi:hypothetical protein BX666DRAFT_1873745 [Dichotomocladium elegans]|nr:hypothetical protein BX666DRAFT_1873745 [Dichotomocladium elegans]